MTVREQTEKLEHQILTPHASFSDSTRGREIPEEPCDLRTDYQRDRDRILHSKAFRRLKQKTQVFLIPEGDHYRTRMTHTLEVSQIARTISRALRLNDDLVEAIALGHDLGHTPFGHAGEKALNDICPEGFRHTEQSLRMVDFLEKDGEGLNLTWETRDGILNHRTSGMPETQEGQVVRICDKIAYLYHDIDDAERAGILMEENVPRECRTLMGDTPRKRLNALVHDLIENSEGRDQISQSPGMEAMMAQLRSFMFRTVYRNPVAKHEEKKAVALIQALYYHYKKHPMDLPSDFLIRMEERGESLDRTVCDYIAGMTDSFAIRAFTDLKVPKAWSGAK